jgi:hypothetical protein
VSTIRDIQLSFDTHVRVLCNELRTGIGWRFKYRSHVFVIAREIKNTIAAA